MMNTIKRLVLEEEGQGMAEYALIVAAIAVVCIVAYRALGTKVNTTIENINADENW